jgi:hypothetical protein
MSDLVTDDDLARARQDPDFRQRFYAGHLDRLLEKLNDLRKKSGGDPGTDKQIKEGVELAVQLADLLNSRETIEKAKNGSQAA